VFILPFGNRRRLEALWLNFKFFGSIAIGELVIIFLVIYLLSSGLLDVKTLVSVVLGEVSITLVLYYLLGERRRGKAEEFANILDSVEKTSHLKGYYFSVAAPLPVWFYYVENSATGQYYKAPNYVVDMIDRGIIDEFECKNEKELREILAKNKSNPNEREANPRDLLPFPTLPKKKSGKQTQLS
jgi:hypothetical protein